MTLTTTCLGEAPYVFPGWGGVPLDGYSGPKEVIVEVTKSRTKLADEEEKADYRTAVTAWVIVMIILIVILSVLGFLVY